MIKLLRNYDIQSATTSLLLLILTASALFIFNEVPAPVLYYPMSREISDLLSPAFLPDSTLAFILALLIILLQAFYFNFLLNQNRVLHKNTYLPSFFYGYFCLFYPVQMSVTPQLISSTFVVFAIGNIFKIQGRTTAMPYLINSGMFIGLALMFLPQIIILLPLFLVAIFLFKQARLNDFLQFLLGMILPLYFTFAIAFFLGFSQSAVDYFSRPLFHTVIEDFHNDPIRIGVLIFLGIILLPVVFRLQSNFFRNTIQMRKYQQFLMVYFVLALIMIVFGNQPVKQNFLLISAPLGAFLAYYFLPERKKFWQEGIMLLMLVALAVNHLM